MLEIRKKGDKHWLFIDNEIGEFTPSKFTINRLNNVITIVYFNNLKSKDYNVSDCYIFDIGDVSGFNTSDGVAFMDKLEELNCPCFQKDETIIVGGSVESVNGQTGIVVLDFADIATAQNLGEFIDGLDSKTDIKDDDEFILSDSEDSLKSKKTRFLYIKNKLKGYFDTFYLSLSVFNDFVTDVFDSLDNKLDKSTTASSVYGTDASGGQTMIPLGNFGTVKGTGTANRVSKFTAIGTIADSQIFDNGTNVGIGTTSPVYKLDVVGSNSRLRVKDSSTNSSIIDIEGGGGSFYLGTDNSSGSSFGGSAYAGTLYRSGAYPISMWTNGLERMRIDSSGNVGIGTTSPQAMLDVRAQGALSTDIAFRVRNSTDTANLLQINGQGTLSLGLQSTAPTGIEGAIYYDSTTKKHYGFDGTNWNALY